MGPLREECDKWFYLKIKHKSSIIHVREVLEKSTIPFCFLADLPDLNRGCCKRLRKDFLNDRLLVGAQTEEVDKLIRQNKEHLRFVGHCGKAASPILPAEYRQLTLFFDKLDRDFVFEAKIPGKAKKIRLPGGNMAGTDGFLEYRGIGGYRLYVPILDLCTVSIRIDKRELAVVENKLLSNDPFASHWYVLYSRREREFYDLLIKRGYQAYLPFRIKKGANGKDDKELVMRGYVFLNIAPFRFHELFKDIPGVSDRLLFDRSQSIRTPLIIPDKQFEDFVFITECDSSDILLTEQTYQAGDPVKLTKKGFEGIEGKLVKQGNQLQVFISLPHLPSGYLIHVEKGEFV